MLMDLLYIEHPKDKNKLNFYLNDNNYYVKNSLKMRKTHLDFYHNNLKAKKEQKRKYPVPKTLYATSEQFLNKDEQIKKKKNQKEEVKNKTEHKLKEKISENLDNLRISLGGVVDKLTEDFLNFEDNDNDNNNISDSQEDKKNKHKIDVE